MDVAYGLSARCTAASVEFETARTIIEDVRITYYTIGIALAGVLRLR